MPFARHQNIPVKLHRDDREHGNRGNTYRSRKGGVAHSCECGSHSWAPLTKGLVTLVSPEGHDTLKSKFWSVNGNRYAEGSLGILHRLIMRPDKQMQVDHINGNRVDNRRENLRVCGPAENARNRKTHSNNKASGHKGVYFYPECRKPWRAAICKNYKTIRLGHFSTKEEAAEAYQRAAHEMFGEFART